MAHLLARLIAWLLCRGPVVVDLGRTRVLFDPRTGRLMPQIAGGAPDDDDADKDDDADDDKDDADKGDDDADKDDDADADKGAGDDLETWKRNARKHERESKRLRKERDDLAKAQKEREDADKSEHEKALDAAREEGRTAALTESQKERRSDRLEVTVTRLAARGIEVKDGEKTKTLKFADPEDALVFIERAIARGDLDEEDVFDDKHRVKDDAIEEALADLLTRKPRLAAGDDGGNGSGRKGAGDADSGKGKGAGKSLTDLSPDEHLKQIQSR